MATALSAAKARAKGEEETGNGNVRKSWFKARRVGVSFVRCRVTPVNRGGWMDGTQWRHGFCRQEAQEADRMREMTDVFLECDFLYLFPARIPGVVQEVIPWRYPALTYQT